MGLVHARLHVYSQLPEGTESLVRGKRAMRLQ